MNGERIKVIKYSYVDNFFPTIHRYTDYTDVFKKYFSKMRKKKVHNEFFFACLFFYIWLNPICGCVYLCIFPTCCVDTQMKRASV